MKNAIILHGTCSREEYYDSTQATHSNNHWLPWLSKQLMVQDIHTVSLEIPNAYDEKIQDYSAWSREIERFDVGEETILIGHSFGAGFFLRWLSENPEIRICKLILVAPWLDPEKIHKNFFEFRFDSELSMRVNSIIMLSSKDDSEDVQSSVKKIQEYVSNFSHSEFSDKGHFTYSSLGTEQFPELLDVILRNE